MMRKNRKLSEETKRKIGLANKGKIRTPETRKKMSEIRKGRKHSEETKRKIGIFNMGRKCSKETKRKISQVKKGQIPWNKGLSSDKHYNWQGGISFEPYTTDWTETLKRAIRERDHYICRLCQKLQGEIAHDVHHIDYNKKNCNSDNLITLCRNCNLKVNFNREYWSNYFSKK